MKKNTIIITGGAGFVGTNLISLFLKKTKFKIISIDNYSSGTRKNHINSPGYNLNKWKRLSPIINEIDLKDKTLIDIGCGDGYYAIECAKMGAKYVLGTDIDSLRIKRGILAKEVFNLDNP